MSAGDNYYVDKMRPEVGRRGPVIFRQHGQDGSSERLTGEQ